ncbi:MAG: sugar-binding protein [Selenomonadaceae bacterium]|nr:sugar-binding protein [Selenomonadaceae bacterium]
MLKQICISAMLLMMLTLVGCGGADDDEKKVVAVSFPNTTGSWQRNGDSIKRFLEDDNFVVDLQFAGSPAEQSSQIANLIEEKPQCIVIGALDSAGLANVLKGAKENDIPIIAFDRIILGTDAVSYYASYDNEAIGEAMGMYFEAALNLKNGGGPYNIELFAGAPSDNNAHLFFKKTMEILEPYFRSGQLVCRSNQRDFNSVAVADWNSSNARTRIKNILDTYYTGGTPLHAVLSPNDDIAGVILEEMKARGMAPPMISGLDADPAAIERIKAGQQTFTVGKDPDHLTAKCVRMIKAVVEGIQPDINDVKTYDNGVKVLPAYLCTPMIIDKTNVGQFKG